MYYSLFASHFSRLFPLSMSHGIQRRLGSLSRQHHSIVNGTYTFRLFSCLLLECRKILRCEVNLWSAGRPTCTITNIGQVLFWILSLVNHPYILFTVCKSLFRYVYVPFFFMFAPGIQNFFIESYSQVVAT